MERLHILRTLDGMLELLMSEIRYGRATLPECCRQLSGRMEEPFASCLEEIYKRTQQNTGEKFSVVFCEAMSECLSRLPVKVEDRENFLQFVSSGSYVEGEMQLRALEQSRELLGYTIAQLELENGEKCRMAVGLGAMSGLLLLLVLL